jgi:hypothetical protein
MASSASAFIDKKGINQVIKRVVGANAIVDADEQVVVAAVLG